MSAEAICVRADDGPIWAMCTILLFVAIYALSCGAAPTPAFAQERVPACDVDYALFSRDTLWVYVELRKPPARVCVLDLAGRKAK